jgi:LPS sulfotransferase NodH
MIDLLKHFPSHWQAWEKCAAVDWAGANVSRKYFILTTGRSGSTHLADLLLGTRRVGWPLEYFNEASLAKLDEAQAAESFCNYLQRLASTRSSGGVFGFKIDIWRLESLLSLINFPNIFPPSDTALVVMTREDKVDQAYSFAVARSTGAWHSVDADNARREHMPSDVELWMELLLIAAAEARIERYLDLSKRNALRVTYEGLIEDRDATLSAIFRHIGVTEAPQEKRPVPEQFAVQPIAYSRREEVSKVFKAKFARILGDLQNVTADFNRESICQRLYDDYGLKL